MDCTDRCEYNVPIDGQECTFFSLKKINFVCEYGSARATTCVDSKRQLLGLGSLLPLC